MGVPGEANLNISVSHLWKCTPRCGGRRLQGLCAGVQRNGDGRRVREKRERGRRNSEKGGRESERKHCLGVSVISKLGFSSKHATQAACISSEFRMVTVLERSHARDLLTLKSESERMGEKEHEIRKKVSNIKFFFYIWQ